MSQVNIHRDPSTICVARPRPITQRKLFLGIDLGTTTGIAYAFHDPKSAVVPRDLGLTYGQWDLSAGSYDSGAIRFVRLRQFLSAVTPDAVFYEMVRNTPAEKPTPYNVGTLLARAVTAAQLFGAFQAHVCAWCEENGVPCTSFAIGEIKKRATGRGNSGKEDVIAAANTVFGLDLDAEGYENTGVDNIADAAFCLLLGLENYGRGIATS